MGKPWVICENPILQYCRLPCASLQSQNNAEEVNRLNTHSSLQVNTITQPLAVKSHAHLISTKLAVAWLIVGVRFAHIESSGVSGSLRINTSVSNEV